MIKKFLLVFYFFYFSLPNILFAKSEYFKEGIELFNKKNLKMQDLNLNKI